MGWIWFYIYVFFYVYILGLKGKIKFIMGGFFWVFEVNIGVSY